MTLIVTGHQRSGTTLLMRLLNSHPEIQITGEFGNFGCLNVPYPVHARFIWRRWLDKRNASFLFDQKRAVKGMNMLQNLGFINRYLLALFRRHDGLVGVKEIDAALKIIFPGRRITGDKYPDYGFQLKQFSQEPELKILNIYRDPRDVASSSVKRARTDWQKTWPAALRDPRNIARRWVQLMELVERNPVRVHSVRYEDLVREPQVVLSSLGDWLNVDPKGMNTGFIKVDRVGKHQAGLSEEETAAVIDIAGPVMQRFGYTP